MMKNRTQKVTSIILTILIIAQCFIFSGCLSNNTIKIMDNSGNLILSLNSMSDNQIILKDNEYRAYLEIVLSEAEQIISEILNCDIKQARDCMINEGYVIYTAFDKEIYSCIENAYNEQQSDELSFGCAVTDLKGTLLAAFSEGSDEHEYINYAVKNTPPYSSFKPLSVYTPAIENNLINWSTMYEDSPVKNIIGSDGQYREWPVNSTGTYSFENASIATAIKESLNTVAVKCLQTLGVKQSFAFLKENFDLTLEFEQNKAALQGDEEVLGNVALGYLYDGVSPVDMAGYYQVFANGGIYNQPRSIVKICDGQGNAIYELENPNIRIIKESTAFIVNKLLQEVVSYGGTGEKARCNDVVVGGKTGTGDEGNWFVGFTPQYSCAIWHGKQIPKNHAAEIFSTVVSSFEDNEKKDFFGCSDIKKAVYCCESGMLLSEKCFKIDMGYYATDGIPDICNKH